MISDNAATLDQLAVGQSAEVAGLEGSPSFRQRLREMGLTIGTRVRLVRVAPLGDPIELAVRGYRLGLRRAEAAFINIARREMTVGVP